MFWIILGTASITALMVSWGMMLWYSKIREFVRKNGFCPDCGAPLLIKMKKAKKKSLGFKL